MDAGRRIGRVRSCTLGCEAWCMNIIQHVFYHKTTHLALGWQVVRRGALFQILLLACPRTQADKRLSASWERRGEGDMGRTLKRSICRSLQGGILDVKWTAWAIGGMEVCNPEAGIPQATHLRSVFREVCNVWCRMVETTAMNVEGYGNERPV